MSSIQRFLSQQLQQFCCVWLWSSTYQLAFLDFGTKSKIPYLILQLLSFPICRSSITIPRRASWRSFMLRNRRKRLLLRFRRLFHEDELSILFPILICQRKMLGPEPLQQELLTGCLLIRGIGLGLKYRLYEQRSD